jgi:hypothetical protein
MFGFLKPEVSGMKSVLNGYFAYKNEIGFSGDLTADQVRAFAYWFYSVRLSPQIMGAQSAHRIQIARERFDYISQNNHDGFTLVTVLRGLLLAENQDASAHLFYNNRSLARVCDKFPPINPSVLGI